MLKTNTQISKKYTTSFYHYLSNLSMLSFLSLFIFVTFEAFEMYLYHGKVIECRNKSHARGQNTPAMFFISVFWVEVNN